MLSFNQLGFQTGRDSLGCHVAAEISDHLDLAVFVGVGVGADDVTHAVDVKDVPAGNVERAGS